MMKKWDKKLSPKALKVAQMAINRTNLVTLETYNRKMKTPTIVLPTQLGRHSITQKPQVQKKEFK